MKFIKRRTQMTVKNISELQWQQAYTKYLEVCVLRPSTQTVYRSLQDFKMFSSEIWRPIPEIDLPVETEEKFVERITKIRKKEEYTGLQFVANQRGEVTACILF